MTVNDNYGPPVAKAHAAVLAALHLLNKSLSSAHVPGEKMEIGIMLKDALLNTLESYIETESVHDRYLVAHTLDLVGEFCQDLRHLYV